MSLKGVRQLKELLIRYSDYDGSSRGVREWMLKELVPLATANPSLAITTELKRSKHPFLRGFYLNGNVKTIDIRNEDPAAIQEYVIFLRNQVGRKMANGYKKPVMSTKPSIQGEWHERMDLLDLKLEIETKIQS